MRVGDALEFVGVPERIDKPASETFVTVKLNGSGAVKRNIGQGKTPVPFTGYRVKSGEFIYSRIDARNGAFAIIPPFLDGAVVSKDFPIFGIREDRAFPSYLMHFFRSGRLEDLIRSRSRGATNRQRVKEDEFLSFPLELPSLEEQRRIAAILDKADSIRAKRRQVPDHLDALTQSIFHDMFDAPSLPKAPLASIIDGDDRINYGVVQPGDEYPGGVPLIRVSDLMRRSGGKTSLKKIDPSIDQKYQRSRIKGNEILVSCVGSIGDVAEVTEELVGCNIARAVSRVPISDPGLRTYVADYLRGEKAQRYFRREIRLVAQPTLNVKQLAALEIPIPGKTLTEVYERRRAALASVWRNVERAIEHDEVFFASLQSRAFTGEL